MYIENSYQENFRKNEIKELTSQLDFRRSVIIMGMKRVGISYFLKYFVNNVTRTKNHIYVSVDLNELFEKSLLAFWRLTLKRFVDQIKASVNEDNLKKEAENHFAQAIQSGDLFLTIEAIRSCLSLLDSGKYQTTIFFIRFDRLKGIFSSQFYSNIENLMFSTGGSLAYVVTSDRELNDIAPKIFDKSSTSFFFKPIYLKPANKKDSKSIFSSLKNKYFLELDNEVEDLLLDLSAGHFQYLQISFAIITELNKKLKLEELKQKILKDERIILQSEELFTSLNSVEKDTLIKAVSKQKFERTSENEYLWKTEILNEKNEVFSPLLQHYIQDFVITKESKPTVELTKKENLLYKLLSKKMGELVERDAVVNEVWPEYKEYGVSDWSIDKLIARLRKKLKIIAPNYTIQTIKTRGFRLVSA